MRDQPKILIIAGPNGAGKTTFATEFLPNEAECRRFINADFIAAGLSPFAPDTAAVQAGRLMLRQIDGFSRQRLSFSFETTLSGRGLVHEWALYDNSGPVPILLEGGENHVTTTN